MALRAALLKLCLVALTLPLYSGCAPKARLQVWRPATEEIQGVERLAILDLDGPEQSGKIARSALEEQFAANRHYTLVDPAVLAQVRPLKTSDGSTDVAAALEAAKVTGVDAILVGQVVSYNVADDEQHDTHFSFGGSEGNNKRSGASISAFGIGIDNNETLTREASVSLAVKLIDVQSQKMLSAKQTSHMYTGQQVNGQGELKSRERVLTELLHSCSQDIVRLLAPHHAPAEVTLARQWYGSGLSDLRRGNELAKKGDWQGATAAWESAREANPKNHAALFNLALAAEARQDLPGALRLLDDAIQEYPAGLYHDARKRMQEEQRLYLAAARQVDAKKLAPSLARRSLGPPASTLPGASPFEPQPASFEEPAIDSRSDQPRRLPSAE